MALFFFFNVYRKNAQIPMYNIAYYIYLPYYLNKILNFFTTKHVFYSADYLYCLKTPKQVHYSLGMYKAIQNL